MTCKVMTFLEWRNANRDMEDEIRGHRHPSGVTWGEVDDMCEEIGEPSGEARSYVASKMQEKYKEQVKTDQEKLKRFTEGS